MKRQGLQVTIGQLRRIADQLEKETKDLPQMDYARVNQIIHQINIINEQDLSDTWEIEE